MEEKMLLKNGSVNRTLISWVGKKINAGKYPTVERRAHDILANLIRIVASESEFSIDGQWLIHIEVG